MIRLLLAVLRRLCPPQDHGATTYTWRGQQITRHDYQALRDQGVPVTEVDAALAVRRVRDRVSADWAAWEQEVTR